MAAPKDNQYARGGRPTVYTPSLGDYICAKIAQKIPMVKICAKSKRLPSPRTVYRWLREHEEFRLNYERAKEDQAHYLAEDTLQIADDMDIDPQHKRLMIDTRKWLSSHFHTKKYGDKVTQEVNINDYSNMDNDELSRALQQKRQEYDESQTTRS